MILPKQTAIHAVMMAVLPHFDTSRIWRGMPVHTRSRRVTSLTALPGLSTESTCYDTLEMYIRILLRTLQPVIRLRTLLAPL